MPTTVVAKITAAGAVFVGRFAAETLGDYAAGPSHVLPTDGAARTLGGITTASFMTSMSVQSVTEAAAAQLAPSPPAWRGWKGWRRTPAPPI
jgi:histidinol dehydrogenase